MLPARAFLDKRFIFLGIILSSILLLVFNHQSAWLTQDTLIENLDYLHDKYVEERLGYVTWLGGPGNDTDAEDDYFIAARILCYQILHAPATKSPRGLPMIVMATPDVATENKQRLRDDGATVVEIDFVQEPSVTWLKPGLSRWMNIMSKLRAWQLTDYSRLLMLDGDMLLRRPLDGIFNEPNATVFQTLPEKQVARKSDEGLLPARYLFAGGPEVHGTQHHWPPSYEKGDFVHPADFNMGFVMFSPSLELFEHYLSILRIKDRFNSETMEQSLLNYAHRLDGPMPWHNLPPTWNIRHPLEEDIIIGNVASIHDKWWNKVRQYPIVHTWYESVKDEMLAFHLERDHDRRQRNII